MYRKTHFFGHLFSPSCSMLIAMICLLTPVNIYARFQDPTAPPPNIEEGGEVTSASFILNAVIIDHHRRIAVINGLNKKIGEELLGEHITSINEKTVQLEGPSGKITLFIFGEPVKLLRHVGCKRNVRLCTDASKQLGFY